MSQLAVFEVLVPAQAKQQTGEPTPDPCKTYTGTASMTPHEAARQIGQAMVFGGIEVSGRIHGCTYLTPEFQIPGFGVISFQ